MRRELRGLRRRSPYALVNFTRARPGPKVIPCESALVPSLDGRLRLRHGFAFDALFGRAQRGGAGGGAES